MDDQHLKEPDHLNVIGHLAELRKRILYSLAALALFTVIAFSRGRDLIRFAQRPAEGLIEKLIFIAPEEVFVAYVKISLLFGLILSFPFILYQLWAFIVPALEREKQRSIILWAGMTLAFFIIGILFSYYVAIPGALGFLVYFGEGVATANVTLNKYISFFGAFMLIGGMVFEIPIMIGLLADIGILRTAMLRQNRRFAILVILIIAAVITPTQDIVNLLVFSVPMMLLYEIGIGLAAYIEKKKLSWREKQL